MRILLVLVLVVVVLVVLVIGKNKVNSYSDQLKLGEVCKFGVEFDNIDILSPPLSPFWIRQTPVQAQQFRSSRTKS